jgi:hypothetical protein
MPDKLEFASPQWLAALQKAYEDATASAGPAASGVAFTMCEVYTGVPSHLSSSGTLAWKSTVKDGVVVFKHEDDPAADLHVTVDYASVLPLGRLVVEGDPKAEAEMNRIAGEAIRAGKFTVKGDAAKRPAFLAGVHDRMARITA